MITVIAAQYAVHEECSRHCVRSKCAQGIDDLNF